MACVACSIAVFGLALLVLVLYVCSLWLGRRVCRGSPLQQPLLCEAAAAADSQESQELCDDKGESRNRILVLRGGGVAQVVDSAASAKTGTDDQQIQRWSRQTSTTSTTSTTSVSAASVASGTSHPGGTTSGGNTINSLGAKGTGAALASALRSSSGRGGRQVKHRLQRRVSFGNAETHELSPGLTPPGAVSSPLYRVSASDECESGSEDGSPNRFEAAAERRKLVRSFAPRGGGPTLLQAPKTSMLWQKREKSAVPEGPCEEPATRRDGPTTLLEFRCRHSRV